MNLFLNHLAKKVSILLLLIAFQLSFAQAPQKMSYQSVLRDATGSIMAATTVGMKISILQGSASGTAVYAETQTATSNANGLVSLEIGTGTVLSGTFSAIDWSAGNYYIKAEVDPTGGTNYSIAGTSQLLSVPYALYATSSGSSSSGDNLGNHTATQNMNLGTNYLSTDGDDNGLYSLGDGYFIDSRGYFTLGRGDNLSAELLFKNSTNTNWFVGTNRFSGAYESAFTIGQQTSKPFVIYTGNSNDLLSLKNSNVGIGTASPTEKLEVSGKTKTTNFQMTNGAANNTLLVSDSNGNASWQNISDIKSGADSTSANNSSVVQFYNPGDAYSDSINIFGQSATISATTNVNLTFNISPNVTTDTGYYVIYLVSPAGTQIQVASGYLNFNVTINSAFTTIASNGNQALQTTGNYGFYNSLGQNELINLYGESKNGNWKLFFHQITGNDTITTYTLNNWSLSFSENPFGDDLGNHTATSNLKLGTNSISNDGGNEGLSFSTNGNGTFSNDVIVTGKVGIGTTAPSEKLEVLGKTKTTNFQMTTGATNGYVLKSDASGNASWVNPTTLSNGNWTTSGINQYNALSGNVGIGTTAPSEKLEVSGKTKTTNFQMTNGATNGYVLQSDTSGNASWINPTSLSISESDPQVSSSTSNMMPKWNGTTLVDGRIYDNGTRMAIGNTIPEALFEVSGSQSSVLQANSTNAGGTYLKIKNSGTGGDQWNVISTGNGNTEGYGKLVFTNSNATAMTLDTDGEVGIGTSSPNSKLHISGTGSEGSLVIQGTDFKTHFNYAADNSEDTYIRGGKSTSKVVINDTSTGNIILGTNNNVGIGVTSPTNKLEVNGKTKTTNLQITSGATNGYVLQSDASGNATWSSTNNLGAIHFVGTSYLSQNSGLGSNGSSEGTSGDRYNIAIGEDAFVNNTVGSNSIALGNFSLENNTIGNFNIGIGPSALNINTSGSNNVAIGKWAGDANGTGSFNTLIGDGADVGATDLINATAIGANAIVNTSNSLILGSNANVGIGTTSPTSKLDIQGSTATNASVLSTGAGAYFSSASVSGQENGYLFKTYSAGTYKNRWLFGKASNSETGSNVGSDFFINRYNDAGSYIGQPLAISRYSGSVTIGNDGVSSSENTLQINGSVATAVATKTANYTLTGKDYCVIFTGSSATTFTLPSASTCIGRVYLIVNQGSINLTTSAYRTAIATTSTSISVGANVQLISDGSEWRKIN